MYDITDNASFQNTRTWLQEIDRYACENVNRILVGAKADLEIKRVVSYDTAKKFADSNNMQFLEASSKSGQNVENIFYSLARDIASKMGATDLGEPSAAVVPAKSIFKESDGAYNSDEESFSEEEFDEDLDCLLKKAPKKGNKKEKKARAKHKRTNVNICNLTMADLVEDRELMTGDPVFCKHCGVILNSYSKLTTKKPKNPKKYQSLVTAPPIHPCLEEFAYAEQPNTISDGDKYWECEFCFGINIVDLEDEEIPNTPCMDYITSPAPVVESSENYSNVVFCIDVSGSMCVTSELNSKINLRGLKKRQERNRQIFEGHEDFGDQFLPGQSRGVSFVSRLQCVQSAVDHQICKYQRNNPETRVGLVSFSNDVTLIGDGTQEQTIISGDRLYNWDELQEAGSKFTISKSVSEAKEVLLDKLWDLEENGATALGPALQLSIAIAGSKPGSQVILCTDGLANIGLGSLEGKETQYTPYYTELAEQAKLKGVTVSVISLIGSECSLENLSTVTDQTGGMVTRVDPLQLEGELATIDDKPILGFTTMAMVILHRGLRFQNEMDDENENRNWIVKDLGNVRADTELSFSYDFRSKAECDLTDINEIPFQVHLIYTKPNGAQCLRVASAQITVTNDRSKAEKNANLNVIGTHVAQKAALLAKGGEYEQAQMETRAAQRFMLRNGVKKEALSEWSNQLQEVDDVLRSERKKEAPSGKRNYRNDSSVAAFSKQKKLKSKFY